MKATPKKPQDPDAALSACYLRLLGATQEAAAAAVGIGERTLRGWEKSEWWPKVEAEARGRWLRGIEAATRSALLSFVETDPATVRFCAERLFPELAPPALRRDLLIEDRRPVKIMVLPELLEPEAWERAVKGGTALTARDAEER